MTDSLDRYLWAQESCYQDVLAELRAGHKRTHWMWFVFPQVLGLGFSETTRHYAIKSIDEARQYLAHPVLGARLIECTEAVLAVQGRDLYEIFGDPDHWKFRSSMTLFEYVSEPDSCFAQALDRCCDGNRDDRSLEILASWN